MSQTDSRSEQEVSESSKNVQDVQSEKSLPRWQEYVASFKLFTPEARLFLVIVFLIGINFEVMQLLLNLYLKERGLLEGQIGTIHAARAVGMALIAIPGALLIQRHSTKPIVMAGCLGFGLFSGGLLTNAPFLILALTSLCAGMSYGLFRVSQSPFFMRHSSEGERGHLFSSGFASIIFAGALGSLVAGKLVQLLTSQIGDSLLAYRLVLGLAIVTGMCGLIPASMLPRKDSLQTERRELFASAKRFWERRAQYGRVLFSNMLVGLGAGLIIPFLNLYLRDQLHLSTSMIGVLYSILSFSMVVGTLTMPLFTRRFGLVGGITIVQSTSIPFMLTLAITVIPWLAIPAFLMRGTFMNMGVPGQHQFAMESSREEDRQFMNAVLILALTSAWAIASQLGGLMIEHFGYTTPIIASAILYSISSVLFFSWFHRGKSGGEDANISGDVKHA